MAATCSNSKITEEMRLQVLNDHNKLRSQLANGESVANGGHKMPKSSNMQELEWDCTLEERAQKWAENCEFEHSKQEFRNFSGENLYARWENHELMVVGRIRRYAGAINDGWNSMECFAFYSGIQYLNIFSMAWAITSKLGCGMARCLNNNGYKYMIHVVCHYDPRYFLSITKPTKPEENETPGKEKPEEAAPGEKPTDKGEKPSSGFKIIMILFNSLAYLFFHRLS
ncbi:unnamed protein product [Dracunculus medinensis]|uniref:SCP domain-containing protein n=1 Tax=Dracunculus medinensis TaxID=318479 RepID=A0A158Q4P3_DRAME|nr:unnamed protein product [Dracunculus medinensis]